MSIRADCIRQPSGGKENKSLARNGLSEGHQALTQTVPFLPRQDARHILVMRITPW